MENYPSLEAFLCELGENCLLLARHGRTDWNEMKIIQGQQDRPLSLAGFRERRNLFFLLNPIPLYRICCSTLQRAIQTAMPLSIEKNVPLEKRNELNEAKLGVFEGQHKEEFVDEFSRSCYQSFLNDEINVALPGGGENLKMVDRRVRALIATLLEDVRRSGHVLVVGHRNVNKMIIRNLLGLSMEEGYQVEHESAWLYLFAPKRAEIFQIIIPPPQESIEVRPGYEKLNV